MSEMETQFQVQKSRSFLKDGLNNSTLRWSQIQLATKAWSTSKSSQILSVLIQTWTTRVLYTQERSRWLQLFYTELFWFTKLPQNSFKHEVRSPLASHLAKIVPASQNAMESRSSALHYGSPVTPVRNISLESPNNHVMQKRQIKKYAIQTNWSNRSRVGVQGHLSQMILGTNQSQQWRSITSITVDK